MTLFVYSLKYRNFKKTIKLWNADWETEGELN